MSRLHLTFLAVVVGALVVAAPAAAKKPEDRGHKHDAVSCPDRDFSRIFSTFHDRSLYTLAPDGDFEAGASEWTLEDGAAVVGASSSILLGDALGVQSLELADGASAVSPEICVARGFRSIRFVTQGTGRLRVDVVYANGRVKKAGRVRAREDWRVTRKLSLAQGRFRVKRGASANVQLRFTASGGPVRVDDVYVDPRFRG
jgi:hypothetical protein